MHFNYQIYFLTFLSLFFFNFFYSVTIVCIFSPCLYPTPAKPTSLLCFHPSPWFCPHVPYSSSWKPFSPLPLPRSPLAIVRLFLTTMSLVSPAVLHISRPAFPQPFFYFISQFLNYFIVQLQLSAFSPHLSTPPQPNPPPSPASIPPRWFCPCVL